ncbi:UDP-N-acetylglucosamine--N-acetylmuramyl [Sesbania bispinosa]|nr:UDP-N-acetylglucosamine--N-acetylmuramyl [Sesbania bispinosa]
MDRTRQTAILVTPKGSALQVLPKDSPASSRYSWIDDVVCDANSIVSEDDVAAYLARLPVPHSFELIWHPRTGIPLFNRWWTREQFFQGSSKYYVLQKQLTLEQENLFNVLEGSTIAEIY